jgi:hypothetical protein
MLVYPDLDPVAFAAGPVKVHWYGIMYVVGFVAGWWLARRRAAMPGSTWKPIDVRDAPTRRGPVSCSAGALAGFSSTVSMRCARIRLRSSACGRAACRFTGASSA